MTPPLESRLAEGPFSVIPAGDFLLSAHQGDREMRGTLLPAVVLAACSGLLAPNGSSPGADDKPAEGLPPALFRVWMHSREEDAGGVKVYRPEGYKFPPSRGRTGFEIKKDGGFIAHDIAPTDGILKVPGTWKLEGKDRLVVSFPNTKREPLTLQIVSCDDKMLKVK